MGIIRQSRFQDTYRPRKGPVNLYSLDDCIAYAVRLKASYEILIIWNGIRYQIKHAATEQFIRSEGWEIVRRIPRAPRG